MQCYVDLFSRGSMAALVKLTYVVSAQSRLILRLSRTYPYVAVNIMTATEGIERDVTKDEARNLCGSGYPRRGQVPTLRVENSSRST